MNQTWENGKKNLLSGSISAGLSQIWAPKFFFFFLGFTSISSYTLFQATHFFNKKTNFCLSLNFLNFRN